MRIILILILYPYFRNIITSLPKLEIQMAIYLLKASYCLRVTSNITIVKITKNKIYWNKYLNY